MSKPAAIFVAVAMAVTAGCVAIIASYGLGLGVAQAMLCGFAALAGMAVTHLAFLRAGPQDTGRLDDLDSVVTELQSRLVTIEARLSTLDGAAAERARAATKPVVDEIAALGGLVTTIAKEVAAHDVEIARLKSGAPASHVEAPMRREAARPEPQRAAPQPQAPAPVAAPARLRVPEPFDPAEEVEARETPRGSGDLAAQVDRALAEERIEPHLQPIVALPSRRVSHYEALARLIEADGFLAAEQFLPTAEARGRIGEVDRRMLERAGPVALRLSARGGGAIFVNVSPATLATPNGRAGVSGVFEASPELRRMLVLEMRQDAFVGLSGAGRTLLEQLGGQGVRLSLDRSDDLRFDPRELSRRGVRFVKVAAEKLLDPEQARGAAIHPADLAGLLARDGIDLIATHVEDERTVPELLDMDVRLAQGDLFGVPRPVRPAAADAAGEPPPARPAAARLVPRSAAG